VSNVTEDEMAKKRKTAKRHKPKSYMLVIRVAVPARLVPKLQVMRVMGKLPDSWLMRDLEILNAYYDMPMQPSGYR